MYAGAAPAHPPRYRRVARHLYICVTEIQVSENLIDKPLKCLRGVSEPKGHIREFEKPKGLDDGCFCDVGRINWNLMVCFHHIYCGEGFSASQLLCKVPNGILVGDDPSFQSTMVATGSPTVLFFVGRGGGAKPRSYRNAERYRFEATPRRWISRFGGGPMLAAVGAKLQVVQAWCECNGL
jgi:hypothetical protein